MSFQRIRDPLHNLIEFDAGVFEKKMWELIQSQPFQRLRRIKQLGFSEAVYPGATHTRFAHSLGVFHTARLLTKIIKSELGKSYDINREQRALAAALLHDVGHGPFSHAFEDVGKRLGLKLAKHEKVSDALIRDGEIAKILNTFRSGFSTDVANLIGKAGAEDIYGALVSSQFDADRLDYMRRDRMMAGTQHGGIDFDWLISNLEVGKAEAGVDEVPLESVATFVLGPKAIYAAETYILSLFQLYPTVYFHKATRGLEKIFSELIFQVLTLVNDGSTAHTGLPKQHALVKFAKHPEELAHALALDDTVVMGSLQLLIGAKDPCTARLAKRLQQRDLYKCIDIREAARKQLHVKLDTSQCESAYAGVHLQLSEGHSKALNEPKLQTAIRRSVRDRLAAEALDRACAFTFSALKRADARHDVPPAILLDDAKRLPYKLMQETSGPLERILIRDSDGSLKDVATVSDVVAAIRDFRLVRAYVSRDDRASESKVNDAIQKGVEYALAS